MRNVRQTWDVLPERALEAFRQFVDERRGGLSGVTPAEAVDLMMAFYGDERAEGCDLDADEDMLLFQWGTYDWGAGDGFEFDITRQVMLPDEIDDDAIWQLSARFRVDPTEELRALGRGDKWCHCPENLEEFRRFVRGTAVWRIFGQTRGLTATLTFECAG